MFQFEYRLRDSYPDLYNHFFGMDDNTFNEHTEISDNILYFMKSILPKDKTFQYFDPENLSIHYDMLYDYVVINEKHHAWWML